MAAERPVLEIENLTKKYGEFTALDSMTLSVDKGQILGLIGPNGAGKTTTIKILVGLQRPTSGHATIAGADCVRDAKKIKHLVGYMPDKFGSYENMRVREYLDFFGAAFGISRRIRNKRIDEVMETTNTAWMKDRYVDSLSHGMGQRVGIARTLLHDPKVLILDEPANGLDPQARIEMRELLLKLAGMGKTLLVTSHILPELARICNRAAIMTQGKLRAYGTVEEIGRQVSQRRLVEIQVPEARVPEAARLTQTLVEGDAVVETLPGEGLVRLTTSQTEEGLAHLLTKLVQAGLPVSQFREVQTDLEDAFMKFARDDANRAKPGTATTGQAPTGAAQGVTRG